MHQNEIGSRSVRTGANCQSQQQDKGSIGSHDNIYDSALGAVPGKQSILGRRD
jgi:hypothetical protein